MLSLLVSRPISCFQVRTQDPRCLYVKPVQFVGWNNDHNRVIHMRAESRTPARPAEIEAEIVSFIRISNPAATEVRIGELRLLLHTSKWHLADNDHKRLPSPYFMQQQMFVRTMAVGYSTRSTGADAYVPRQTLQRLVKNVSHDHQFHTAEHCQLLLLITESDAQHIACSYWDRSDWTIDFRAGALPEQNRVGTVHMREQKHTTKSRLFPDAERHLLTAAANTDEVPCMAVGASSSHFRLLRCKGISARITASSFRSRGTFLPWSSGAGKSGIMKRWH